METKNKNDIFYTNHIINKKKEENYTKLYSERIKKELEIKKARIKNSKSLEEMSKETNIAIEDLEI